MKTINDVIEYIQKEIKLLTLEDLSVNNEDSMNQIVYKKMQAGKNVAYERILAYIKQNSESTEL